MNELQTIAPKSTFDDKNELFQYIKGINLNIKRIFKVF